MGGWSRDDARCSAHTRNTHTCTQVLLLLVCSESGGGRCASVRLFVYLQLPSAIFTAGVMRTRGVSWRFTLSERLAPPSLDPPPAGALASLHRLTVPLGVAGVLCDAALAALLLRGLGSASTAAAALYLVGAGAAAAVSFAVCVVLWVRPQLEASELAFTAALMPPDDDEVLLGGLRV